METLENINADIEHLATLHLVLQSDYLSRKPTTYNYEGFS